MTEIDINNMYFVFCVLCYLSLFVVLLLVAGICIEDSCKKK